MKTRFAIYLLCAILPAGCLYEYADPLPTTLSQGTVELTVKLALNINFEMDAGEEQFVQTHEALLADGYVIRYIVDLYQWPGDNETPLSQRAHRLVTTEAAMPAGGVYRFSETVTLLAAHYRALVWVDFVPATGGHNDFYYHTENLQAVTIDNSRPYRGYHVSKDAFTAGVSIDLTPSQNPATRFDATVPVKRPFAFYRIITTDVEEYRDTPRSAPYNTVRPDTVRLRYQAWFPMGYNAYHAVPDNFDASGVHYACGVPETGDSDTDVELAADFVFMNGNETFYNVDFDIFTPAGIRINRHSDVRVNLRRNRVTVLRGAFLTAGNSSGGAGIEFDFDEEFVVFF
jgi:hypothetical protein